MLTDRHHPLPESCPRPSCFVRRSQERLLVVRHRYQVCLSSRNIQPDLSIASSSLCFRQSHSLLRSWWSYVSLLFIWTLAITTPVIAILKGTVNDPTTFPPPSPIHGSYHWAFERLLSAALVPMTAAAFVTSGSSHAILDGVLAVTLVMHTHIGVRSSLVLPLFGLAHFPFSISSIQA